ncbi:hypothetical protein HZI73_00555 [Vallitalea pronyensis]|uniref:Uncharacterized protein n=1 Tax=Vallitalea pronyensis TaxID=1348613 RepID=A0A8J8MFZ5_9FIRM|nr:hypothetical protein [Vallitalea pronyensis]QUI20889.1 hypothetical protein HZI73_00555 [Vallitalea pronyensis]
MDNKHANDPLVAYIEFTITITPKFYKDDSVQIISENQLLIFILGFMS